MITTRKTLGNRGETAAATYLQQKGYTLVGANWRRNQGEFDLIMRQDEILVFVEVRTRKSGLEAALESITPRKRQILEQLAYLYLEEHNLDCDWRIDVIAISPNAKTTAQIEHIENALDW
jgi:putative endonuclease